MALIKTQSAKKKQEEMEVLGKKKKQTKLSFSDLIIPIASGTVFIILCFAVLIPMVNSALEYLDEIKVTNEKIEQLEKLDKALKKLDDDELNENVATFRKVIPVKLLVSDLVYYLNDLAVSLSLEINELASSDALNSVSGPIGYTGSYENILSFLDNAQNVSPYMLRLENVEVSSRNNEGEANTWSVSLQISGYYIADEQEEGDIYANFQSYMEYDDIVEIFKEKAKSLN